MSFHLFHRLTLPPSLLSLPDKSRKYHEVRQIPAVTDRHICSLVPRNRHNHTHVHYNMMWQGPYSVCLSTGTACPSNTHTHTPTAQVKHRRYVTLSFGHLLSIQVCVVCTHTWLSVFSLCSNKPTRVLSVNMWAVRAPASLHCHSHSYLFSHSASQSKNKSGF